MEEVGVVEDDDDLRDVEEDREDEVGDRDVVERPEALPPRGFRSGAAALEEAAVDANGEVGTYI